jgi:hypothetical protein
VVTDTLSENEASVWVVMNDPLVYLHRERENKGTSGFSIWKNFQNLNSRYCKYNSLKGSETPGLEDGLFRCET